MTSKRVFSEELYPTVKFTFTAEKIHFESQTEEQHLVVFDNAHFGRVMMLDGVTQVTTKDEFIYHEMLTHVPILAHGAARKVLIIGGGDGGIAREALRHPTVEHVTMIEIDATVVEFAKTHFPQISDGAFNNPKLTLNIQDGCEFVKHTDEHFDVIIVDSTDPIGPGAVLFTKEFYQDCQRCLTEKGILVTQNGVPFMQGEELTQSVRYFRELFPLGTCYLAAIPTYIGGFMALGFASKDPNAACVNAKTLTERFQSAGLTMRYYTPDVHLASFAHPQFIKDLIDDVRNKS